MKNFVLALSLLLNALALHQFFMPHRMPGSDRMTCEEARSETLNKRATERFAQAHGQSFQEVHSYLTASDYKLVGVSIESGKSIFGYKAQVYPSTCGTLMPGIDGSMLQLETDLAVDPKITAVR